jgi:hypothetical protein
MSVLNLNPSTLQVIANFSHINQSMMFKPGSNLKTVSPNQDIFASATVTEDFPQEFAIYDLSKFLGVLSTYENPKVRFNDKKKYLTIHTEENNEKYNYGFADPSMIVLPPEGDLDMPPVIAEFVLPAKALANLTKRVSISKHPEVAIVSDGENLSIQAHDSKKVVADNYSHTLGKCDKAFKVVFKVEKVTVLMNMDYTVTVSEGIVRFHGPNINYWVAPEETSSYE